MVAVLNLDPPPPRSAGAGVFVPSAYQQDCKAKTGAEIRFDHIPPGKYRLYFSLIDPQSQRVYVTDVRLAVPPLPEGSAPDNVDAGIITLRPMDALHPITPQKPKTAPTAPTTKAAR